MLENNEKYFKKVLEEIKIIEKYRDNYFSASGLKKDLTLDAIIFRLIQVSQWLELVDEMFQLTHPEIRWRDIKGFRNRLVHDYGGVDLEFVEKAMTKDIDILKEQLLQYIEEQ